MTGDAIGAEEALRIGLVNAVVPHAELLPKVREVAAKIATKGPLAIAAVKRVILRGADVAAADGQRPRGHRVRGASSAPPTSGKACGLPREARREVRRPLIRRRIARIARVGHGGRREALLGFKK